MTDAKRPRTSLGLARAALVLALLCAAGHVAAQDAARAQAANAAPRTGEKLTAPAEGKIPVAILLSRGADVIDFAGPWEVFQDVSVPGRGRIATDTYPFQLFTVAESREPIETSGGLKIVPDYTFADAPKPKVIVVPAQAGSNAAMRDWLRSAHQDADLTMSVCTGAFVLASAGLLDGRAATTHHESVDRLERNHPAVRVQRDVRYVEGPRIATAAGLTSGIDLALRVVERYFGTAVAAQTARYMEHESQAWRDSAGYWDAGQDGQSAGPTKPQVARAVLLGHDPVRLAEGREVAGLESLEVTHGRYRYLFESAETKARFLKDPEAYAIQLDGACAFMAITGAPPGSGEPSRYWVHDHRIYIFASENCRNSFKADPRRYLPKTK